MTGSFDSDRLLEPRIRVRVPLPVVPPASCTSNPGARPLSRFDMSRMGALLVMSAGSSLWIALGCSRWVCSPVAVTITASSPTGTDCNAKSIVGASPAATVTARATCL